MASPQQIEIQQISDRRYSLYCRLGDRRQRVGTVESSDYRVVQAIAQKAAQAFKQLNEEKSA